MKRLLIPLMLSLFLSACGFHLRGMIDIPTWINNVAIIAKDNDKELVSILTAQLEGYNIRVNNEPDLATYWLIINRVTLQQNIISVGASTNPRQYALTLTIEYMLQTRKGQILANLKRVRATRQLTINNDRILGSNDEQAILVAEMKQDAVIQIINQLSHLDKGVITLKNNTSPY